MSAQMTLLFLEQTGHVLGALRQLTDAPPAREALTGESFPWRVLQTPVARIAAVFELPSTLLKLTSVAFDENILGHPQSFVVKDDRPGELGSPTPLPTVTLSQTALTVSLANAPGDDTQVFAAVRERNTALKQRLLRGKWLAGHTDLTMNLTILPDGPDAALATGLKCDVALAVAGYPVLHFEAST